MGCRCSIGHYLTKVIAWDFEVSDDGPLVTLAVLPVRPSEVERFLHVVLPADAVAARLWVAS